MGSWWEIVSVFLLSTVKFVLGGVPLALTLGFSFFEAVVVTSLGGFTGVLIFVGLSDLILKKVKHLKHHKQHDVKAKKDKKKFTRKNRLIITVKQRFGLLGIAGLTPFLFSIPIGCFIATRYFKDKQKIIIYMFASVLLWSISISSFKLLF
ncbi:MAG TPA: hypothetical protein PLL00_07725 [Bacteroidia bacterium]|nr:hypothetical protein [Bacteroidia bacterium]